jgi:DNA-binding transcriptional ArsR family regulator
MVTKPAEGEPHRPTIRDPAVLRALAHPARMEILERLMNGPPATATDCAAACGLSPSATSYHLRALARVGLVEEAPSRGDARERVWRSTMEGFAVEPGPEQDPEARAAAQDLVEVFLVRDETRLRRWLTRADQEPKEWYDAAALYDSLLQVTPEELRALNDQVLAVLRPYRKARRTDPPAGSRTVTAMFRAFPLDDPAPSDPTPAGPVPSDPTPSGPVPSDPTPSHPTPSHPTPSGSAA